MTGFARYFLPASYLLPVGLFLEQINSVTILQLFAYRYWAVTMELPSARKYNSFHKFLVFIGYLIAITSMLLLVYGDYESSNATQNFITVSNKGKIKERIACIGP